MKTITTSSVATMPREISIFRSLFRQICLPIMVIICSTAANAGEFNVHCRDRPPYLNWMNGTCVGPEAEITELLLKKAGHTIKWHFKPWVRSLNEAKTGDVDLLPRHSMTDERQTYLYPILMGYRERKIYFYANQLRGDIVVKNFSDLRKYAIGTLKGSYYFDEFQNSLDIQKITVVESEQLAEMLAANRLDLVITTAVHRLDLFENKSAFKQMDYIKSVLLGRYLSIPKASNKISEAEKLEKIMLEMRKDGTFEEIFQKYKLQPLIQQF